MDVSDVDLVLRWGYAYSLDELAQEWGRAGRAGQRAAVVLFLRTLRAPRASPQPTQALERRQAWTLAWQYVLACTAADGGDAWDVFEFVFEGRVTRALAPAASEAAVVVPAAGEEATGRVRELASSLLLAHAAAAAARADAAPPAGALSAAAQAAVARPGLRDGPLSAWVASTPMQPAAFMGAAAVYGLVGREAAAVGLAVTCALGFAGALFRAAQPLADVVEQGQLAEQRREARRLELCARRREGSGGDALGGGGDAQSGSSGARGGRGGAAGGGGRGGRGGRGGAARGGGGRGGGGLGSCSGAEQQSAPAWSPDLFTALPPGGGAVPVVPPAALEQAVMEIVRAMTACGAGPFGMAESSTTAKQLRSFRQAAHVLEEQLRGSPQLAARLREPDQRLARMLHLEFEYLPPGSVAEWLLWAALDEDGETWLQRHHPDLCDLLDGLRSAAGGALCAERARLARARVADGASRQGGPPDETHRRHRAAVLQVSVLRLE